MKIIFIGGMPSGTLKDPKTGKEYEFKRNEPIDVPNALGEEVCKSSIWQAATKEKENK